MADKDLNALFVHQLKDTYFAENAILKGLPQLGTSKNLPNGNFGGR